MKWQEECLSSRNCVYSDVCGKQVTRSSKSGGGKQGFRMKRVRLKQVRVKQIWEDRAVCNEKRKARHWLKQVRG